MASIDLVEVEQVAQKALPLLIRISLALVGITVRVFVLPVVRIRLLARRLSRSGAFNDLVQFPFIQPDPAALGAIIDLDTLSFRHNKCFITVGTFHNSADFRTKII